MTIVYLDPVRKGLETEECKKQKRCLLRHKVSRIISKHRNSLLVGYGSRRTDREDREEKPKTKI